MLEMALRRMAGDAGGAPQLPGQKAYNAREGIETQWPLSYHRRSVICQKAYNAREGIET